MMRFFNRTGLECVGVVEPEPRLLWIGLKALDRRTAGPQALDVALLYKDKKEERPAGASPVAAPMPKSISFSEKR